MLYNKTETVTGAEDGIMPRFFVSTDPDDGGIIRVTGDDARHIALSLRSAVGESITAVRDGTVYECEIASAHPDEVLLRVVTVCADGSEPPCRVTLFVANPKGDKLDVIVQKATELGAARIVPFLSERCVSRPEGGARDRKRARLEKIAAEAAKQCGRGAIPEVAEMTDFKSAVAEAARADAALFVYEKETGASLRDVISGKLSRGMTVSVMTGSEGGFSPAEAGLAIGAGMTACGLGKRILRCETAPLCVLSAILYETEL